MRRVLAIGLSGACLPFRTRSESHEGSYDAEELAFQHSLVHSHADGIETNVGIPGLDA